MAKIFATLEVTKKVIINPKSDKKLAQNGDKR